MVSIPYGKQHITDEDIAAVVSVLKSDFLTQGPFIKSFEDAFAKYVGSRYAVAVSNGTAALHLSALALELQPGQKVITTPITFAASANCIRYCGGEVVFADIDRDTLLIDIEHVRRILQDAPRGTYAGIIVVDFAGTAVNLEVFKELADDYGIWVIEDACHAPGGYFVDKKGVNQYCGNGKFANLSVFSFHPVKHIACGEGGMITTNSEVLYNKLLRLRSHGITRDKNSFINEAKFANGTDGNSFFPDWYMEMHELGFNYRLTDIQAGLGLSQLKRAPDGLARRKTIARRYDEAFLESTVVRSPLKGFSTLASAHAYHLYIIQVPDRLGLYNCLKENGIFAQIHYIPTHLMPYYRRFGWKEGDLPVAEEYYRNCLSIPIYPSLSDEEQEFIISTIKTFYS